MLPAGVHLRLHPSAAAGFNIIFLHDSRLTSLAPLSASANRAKEGTLCMGRLDHLRRWTLHIDSPARA